MPDCSTEQATYDAAVVVEAARLAEKQTAETAHAVAMAATMSAWMALQACLYG